MKKTLFAFLFTFIFLFSVAGCTPETASEKSGTKVSETTVGEETANKEYTAENDLAATTSNSANSTVISNHTVISTPETVENSDKDGQTASFSGAKVTYDYAKSVALNHAGAKENQITDYDIDLDKENGTLVYEISFDFDGYEYDYVLEAATGNILHSHKEKDDDKSQSKPLADNASTLISKAKAKSIALNHAKVKTADIRDYEIELDKDSTVATYEIGFESGKYEFEYEINAKTGKIIKSQKEIND